MQCLAIVLWLTPWQCRKIQYQVYFLCQRICALALSGGGYVNHLGNHSILTSQYHVSRQVLLHTYRLVNDIHVYLDPSHNHTFSAIG